MDQNAATVPVITFADDDTNVRTTRVVNGILNREMLPIDVVKVLLRINTDDGEISAMDVMEAMYKCAGDKSTALRAFCLDKNKLGLIGDFVFKGEKYTLDLNVIKFIANDAYKLHTICLKLSVSEKESAGYEKIVDSAVLVAFNSREISFDDEPIEYDPDLSLPDNEADYGGEYGDQAPDDGDTADPEPSGEADPESNGERQPEPPKKVESADIRDPKVQENLMRGLFKTSMPAITHLMTFLKDFHEKNKTPSFLASMETVPTETTIVWTDPPYDFTVSIIKMKEGRFYRMHLAKTDLSLDHHEYSRTRNIDGRWVQFGRDIQNTMLNQPQPYGGGYRRRY